MAKLPEINVDAYEPRKVGGGISFPERKGGFFATLSEADIAFKKGSEAKLNLATCVVLKNTTPGDADRDVEGVEIRDWTPVLGVYSDRSKRKGQPKALAVVDAMVACGATPTKAIAAVQKVIKGKDDENPTHIEAIKKGLTAIVAKLVGRECGYNLISLSENKGQWNCDGMLVSKSAVEKRMESASVEVKWSKLEERRIEKTLNGGSGGSSSDPEEDDDIPVEDDEDELDTEDTEDTGGDEDDPDPFDADGD